MNSGIGKVDGSALLGVSVGRGALDREADRLVTVAKYCAKRALEELKAYAPTATEEEAVLVEADAKKLGAIAKVADTADRIIRGLLAEQRERAKLAMARPEMTDEEFSRHLAQAVRELSEDELAALRATEQ